MHSQVGQLVFSIFFIFILNYIHSVIARVNNEGFLKYTSKDLIQRQWPQ